MTRRDVVFSICLIALLAGPLWASGTEDATADGIMVVAADARQDGTNVLLTSSQIEQQRPQSFLVVSSAETPLAVGSSGQLQLRSVTAVGLDSLVAGNADGGTLKIGSDSFDIGENRGFVATIRSGIATRVITTPSTVLSVKPIGARLVVGGTYQRDSPVFGVRSKSNCRGESAFIAQLSTSGTPSWVTQAGCGDDRTIIDDVAIAVTGKAAFAAISFAGTLVVNKRVYASAYPGSSALILRIGLDGTVASAHFVTADKTPFARVPSVHIDGLAGGADSDGPMLVGVVTGGLTIDGHCFLRPIVPAAWVAGALEATPWALGLGTTYDTTVLVRRPNGVAVAGTSEPAGDGIVAARLFFLRSGKIQRIETVATSNEFTFAGLFATSDGVQIVGVETDDSKRSHVKTLRVQDPL